MLPLALAAFLMSACRTAGTFDGPDLYARLSESDVALASATLQRTLERNRDDEPANWRNPETGHEGVIWPTDAYLTDTGYFCRRYRETLSVGGERHTYRNAACRNDEGRWVWVE